MKPIQLVVITIAFAFAGCRKSSESVAPTTPERNATPEPIALTVPISPEPKLIVPTEPEVVPVLTTPSPNPAPLPEPVPPPAAKHPEPAVVYFTVQRMSVTTDDGIYSIPPGTQLRLVRVDGPILIVTDGKTEFEAQPTQLTNDLDVATRIAGLDEATRRQVAADRAARAAQLQQRQSQQSTLTIEEMQQMVELAKKIQELRNMQQQQQQTPEQMQQEIDLIERLQNMKRRRR